MGARRGAGLVAIALLVGACSGGPATPPSLLTAPKPGPSSAGRGASTGPSLTPFGAPPVAAPPSLRDAASTYYDGAGPAPQSGDESRPACLLMLPTALRAAPLKSVPRARFNIFDEFEVTWTRADGQGTGLDLLVYPPGDPSDLDFFGPAVHTTTLADGTELRVTSSRPRATLIRVPTQNCEYELEGHGTFPAPALDPVVRSLRLVFAP